MCAAAPRHVDERHESGRFPMRGATASTTSATGTGRSLRQTPVCCGEIANSGARGCCVRLRHGVHMPSEDNADEVILAGPRRTDSVRGVANYYVRWRAYQCRMLTRTAGLHMDPSRSARLKFVALWLLASARSPPPSAASKWPRRTSGRRVSARRHRLLLPRPPHPRHGRGPVRVLRVRSEDPRAGGKPAHVALGLRLRDGVAGQGSARRIGIPARPMAILIWLPVAAVFISIGLHHAARAPARAVHVGRWRRGLVHGAVAADPAPARRRADRPSLRRTTSSCWRPSHAGSVVRSAETRCGRPCSASCSASRRQSTTGCSSCSCRCSPVFVLLGCRASDSDAHDLLFRRRAVARDAGDTDSVVPFRSGLFEFYTLSWFHLYVAAGSLAVSLALAIPRAQQAQRRDAGRHGVVLLCRSRARSLVGPRVPRRHDHAPGHHRRDALDGSHATAPYGAASSPIIRCWSG